MARLRHAGRVLAILALGLALGAAALVALPLDPGVPPADIAALDASVEQGAYLARAANCGTCHTRAEGAPYAGGVAFNTPFGVLYSTNITMDQASGIGAWDFADFHRAMRHGVRPNGSHLYPAFPYTDFAQMTDADIASLYLYLQSLEPVAALVPDNQLAFPYNLRPLLGPWKRLFHRPQGFSADTAQSGEWNRGAYLVEVLGHCGACHTPRNRLGAELDDLAMTGGTQLDQVKLGGLRPWSAVNLTSHATGLAAWSEQDIVDYLKTGASERAVVHGPMREVVMHSTRHLGDSDLQAMATYLKSLPANAQPAGEPAAAGDLAEGEIVYTVHCGSCHLPTGLGDAGLGVPLAGNPVVQAPDPASLINVILYGPHLPERPFAVDRSNMKMFGKRLSDTDIALVASYVRASFGNRAGAVTPEQVRQQR
ncbi:c-type cytochrome [Mangrovimicrobium sediminis]|uniref:C-type cytochrome n=1 Tax=Mangrovimicrobium sediminis TaxID=2562682 RepID=A0A4Z0LWL3_9GAMM|nr:cytochrome c [Haliea sp. SAOS-164]TGD71732.1 c-type cytochrome [Haliea sp. SAOS-164]